ncbi:MAG: choline/carnitine O-acyltransferase [Nesterenkonia sp.]|nr:choline/carnitine O-acyltransferase [Nesterenkonia sp.]
MTLPQLPVPPLDESLPRFLGTYSALAAPEDVAAAEQMVERFRAGPAETLQEDLERFAAAEHAEGRSWLTQEWDHQYMAVREPLTLSSSAAFELALRAETPGDAASRTAEIIHRIAVVHLTEARGETAPEIDPRGNELTMEMWRCLTGGIRHPQPHADDVVPGSADATDREIGVLHDGRLFALPISDHDGRPLGTARLAESLRHILHLGTTSSSAAQTGRSFAGPSALGSEDLAPLLDDMLTDAHNAETYCRLTDLLFTVTLTADAADGPAERLRTFLTEPGRIWVQKPLSYQIDVGAEDDAEGDVVHVIAEHSAVDGGTLIEAVRRMQEVSPTVGSHPTTELNAPQELTWRLTDAQHRTIDQRLRAYRSEADALRVDVLRLPRIPDDQLPFRMSSDGLQQLIMTIAQLIAFDRVRSVYESVDMRQFRAGRTECLRPVTPEAVAFARALLTSQAGQAGESAQDDLVAALDAHRDWVKACKTGHGFDRHLTGLQMIARHRSLEHPFFDSAALDTVRTDLLSTTSLGTSDQIVRYTFAPTVSYGYGIAYTQHPDHFEFTVSHLTDRADRPEQLLGALTEAAQLLHDHIRGLPQTRD